MDYNSQASGIGETIVVQQASYYSLSWNTTFFPNIKTETLSHGSQLASLGCYVQQVPGDWCVSPTTYVFLQGSSAVNVMTQRNDSPGRYFSSHRHAGKGVVWHGAGLAFRALKLCQIELLAWFSPCVEIKTGLLFIHRLSHCLSLSPLLQGSALLTCS